MKLTFALLGILAGAFSPLTLAQHAEEQVLRASDVYHFGRFGQQVAVDGDVALVTDDAHPNSAGISVGGCYVLRRAGGQWHEVQFLEPTELIQAGRFGNSGLALEGDWAFVASKAFPTGNVYHGAVWVYHLTSTGWRQTQRLEAPDATDSAGFGYRIDVDGDRVLISAAAHPTFGGAGLGQAYVFERNGLQWNYVQTLIPSVPETLVGSSLALEDDWAVLSAHNHDAPNPHRLAGAVYVFRRVGGAFVEFARIDSPNPTIDRAFGKQLAMENGTLVVSEGNPWAFFGSEGRIHIYHRSDSSPTGFVHDSVHYASDGDLDNQFAVPASGGKTIAISGDRILVGAHHAMHGGIRTGAAYMFQRVAGQWMETDKLQWSDAQMHDTVGQAVAFDDTTAFVAGPGVTAPSGETGGGVYVYEVPLGVPYCDAIANSTGSEGATWVLGSPYVVDGDVRLRAFGLPPDEHGYFLASRQRAFVPTPFGSQGNLCLGLPIVRFASQVASTGASGEPVGVVDPGALPTAPASAILPGETWNFQAWHRDHTPGLTS
ncbi:MAG: hypothetical protein GY711_06450, partial [bacterium]|nr:hypothetical protein [bacterium]